MKRFTWVFAFLIILLMLSSCEKEDERFFDYQDSLKTVSGSYTDDGVEYKITLYFERADNERFCRRIEYTEPESLCGISYTLEGDKITAELDGIRIAYSYYKAEDVFSLARLFSLSESDIYEISGSSGKKTVAKGKGEGYVWQVVTDESGIPWEITYEDSETAVVFKIEKAEMFQ